MNETVIGQRNRQLVVVMTFLMSLVTSTVARPAADRCQLGEHFYSVGETWQPALGQGCANCTCLEGGKIDCKGPKCPPIDCDHPRHLEGQCCPSCDAPPKIPTSRLEPENLPPAGCDYLDNHYEVGEAFPSNRSALKMSSDDQCVLCHCTEGPKGSKNGKVLCVLQTCQPRPGCRKMVRVMDDCCPVCEDDLLEGGDCPLTNGQRMRNGTSWQPNIEEHGIVECVFCTCMDGKVNCTRLDCPEDSALPCTDPQVQRGECCKICPGRQKALELAKKEIPGKGEVTPRKGRKMDKRKRTGKGKRKKRRCRHLKDQEKKKCRRRLKKQKKRRRMGRKSSGKRVKQLKPEMRVHTAIGRLCLLDDTTHLVYRKKGDNYESLSFDGRNDSKIEQLHWVVRKGKIHRTDRRQIPDTTVFRKHIRLEDVLGAVTAKDIKRFYRRFERREKRCKRKCRRKLIDRTIKKMKLHPLDLTKSCGGRRSQK